MSAEAVSEVNFNELELMKRTELQKLCKQLGLKASGKNSELIERIKLSKGAVEEEDKEEHYESAVEEQEFLESESENKQSQVEPEITLTKNIFQKSRPSFQLKEKLILDELDKRVKTLELDPKTSTNRRRSKSFSALLEETKTKLIRSKSYAKFDNIHRKNFQKMESISAKAPNNFEKPPPMPLKNSVDKVKSSESSSNKRQSWFERLFSTKIGHVRESSSSAKSSSNPMTTSSSMLSKAKKFNLQESLKRPLNYKPYTGKLKPIETTSESKKEMTRKPSVIHKIASTIKQNSPFKSRKEK